MLVGGYVPSRAPKEQQGDRGLTLFTGTLAPQNGGILAKLAHFLQTPENTLRPAPFRLETAQALPETRASTWPGNAKRRD